MFEAKKIAVVIPAFNEERLITRVMETLPQFVDVRTSPIDLESAPINS